MGQDLHTVTTRPAPGVLTPICDECAKAEGVSNDTYGTGCYCSVCHERLTCGWGKLVNPFPPGMSSVPMFVGLPTITTRPAPGMLTPICDECAKAEGVSNDTYGTGCRCSVCHERLTCGWGKLVNLFPPSAESLPTVVMTWVPWTDATTGR